MQGQLQGSFSLGMGLLVMATLVGLTSLRISLEKVPTEIEILSENIAESPAEDFHNNPQPLQEVKGDFKVTVVPDVVQNNSDHQLLEKKIDISPEEIKQDSSPKEFSKISLADFIYPGADLLNENFSLLELSSTDSAEKITAWYESALQLLELNITSFVKTTTNGSVKNELVGADEKIEIFITISQSSELEVTSIKITEVTD